MKMIYEAMLWKFTVNKSSLIDYMINFSIQVIPTHFVCYINNLNQVIHIYIT